MVRMTYCCYAHEPNLNVDQVPPNRALFVQPQLHVRAGLDVVYRWASLTRIHQSGEATRGSCLGRVNGGSLDSQLCFGRRPRLGQVWATRRLEPCGGRVGMTPGYPGHDLSKYVGDAVRGDMRYIGLVGDV